MTAFDMISEPALFIQEFHDVADNAANTVDHPCLMIRWVYDDVTMGAIAGSMKVKQTDV